ncbi:MAG: dipeptidase PepV [Clostridiales bacterium]|nr:dipeptidase PepV [Clostridiales bacterium]
MDFNNIINGMKNDIIKYTQELIRIKSVETEPLTNAPFGSGVNDALMYMLNLASSFGFKTKNIDGHIGYAEFGDGNDIAAVIGHLDVVPEGDGWLYPPYEGVCVDNKIYGRGAIDDKGPLIAALCGLKAVKDSGAQLGKRVRIIFGTDEESGWKDIPYYTNNEALPCCGFTPDGAFPVINAEKGSINIVFKKNILRKSKGMISIKSLTGGNALNIVPNFCTCCLGLKDMAKRMLKDTLGLYCESNKINMSIKEDGDDVFITSHGVSCHSSIPENGVNAISQLIVFLSQFNLGQNDVSDFIKFIAKYIGYDCMGKALNINFSDDISGNLTVNLGRIYIDDENASAAINIRYPVKAKYEDIFGRILNIADENKIEISQLSYRKPLYIEKDSKIVSSLLDAYREVTGKEGYTISIGGQTYAKAFDNVLAFGPVFPGRDDLAHMPDEYIQIDDLINCAKIYSKAIYELAK